MTDVPVEEAMLMSMARFNRNHTKQAYVVVPRMERVVSVIGNVPTKHFPLMKQFKNAPKLATTDFVQKMS